MIRITAFLLIAAYFLSSCDDKSQKENRVSQTKTESDNKNAVLADTAQEIPPASIQLLETLPVRNFPITDSTGFDNFNQIGIPDNGFLKRIQFNPEHTEANDFRLNYKIPFSENFTSLVITYQRGEHELITMLLTVSKEEKIIDSLEISYDEIAESAFSKSSTIEKNKITVTDWNWMNGDNPISETHRYKLNSKGTFEKIERNSEQFSDQIK
ncbi:hypothetical protein [Sphingobacterium cellulitidis]|uniref:hypothetical protein n=1 Tax=Sphingobacterium cellulitidis TaxID=1768011 RepID=UPI000B942CFE|nr:hypothetical protein [Sphingobacterium cellulitidis]